jgi:hypothetical protein
MKRVRERIHDLYGCAKKRGEVSPDTIATL